MKHQDGASGTQVDGSESHRSYRVKHQEMDSGFKVNHTDHLILDLEHHR